MIPPVGLSTRGFTAPPFFPVIFSLTLKISIAQQKQNARKFLNNFHIFFNNTDDFILLHRGTKSLPCLQPIKTKGESIIMETKEKITIDIQKLEDSLKQVQTIKVTEKEQEVIERAVDYKNDSKYYLEKEDMRTSFGCIEYSHGLLDAIRMVHDLI